MKGLNAPFTISPVVEQHAMFLHLLIELRLQRAHLALDDLLDLIRELRLDVLLESTKQERSKNFVETFNDEQRLLFVQLHLIGSAGIGEGCCEPLVEGLYGVENLGEDEVQKRPQFVEFVLGGKIVISLTAKDFKKETKSYLKRSTSKN